MIFSVSFLETTFNNWLFPNVNNLLSLVLDFVNKILEILGTSPFHGQHNTKWIPPDKNNNVLFFLPCVGSLTFIRLHCTSILFASYPSELTISVNWMVHYLMSGAIFFVQVFEALPAIPDSCSSWLDPFLNVAGYWCGLCSLLSRYINTFSNSLLRIPPQRATDSTFFCRVSAPRSV